MRFSIKCFHACLIMIFLCIIISEGLRMIPQRATVVCLNMKYVEYGKYYNKRYGRKSNYYLNIDTMIKHAWSTNVTSLKMIPERAEVEFKNCKYIEYGRLYVRRYTRRGKYYVNVDGKIKKTWGNNVTVNVLLYEFLHNEYRRSFIEFNFKLCDVFPEKYIGGMLRNAGLTCPVLAGEYNVHNLSMNLDSFPNKFPLERAKVEIALTVTDTEELIGKCYLYVTFKK